MDTAMQAPAEQGRSCVHDSTRGDDTLDNCCLRCGTDGYWRNGFRHDRPHPSGKILFALNGPSRPSEPVAFLPALERRIDLEAAEAHRVAAPEFGSLEEFLTWQRELYRPRDAAAEPMPGRDVVVDVRGRQLEILVYALPALKIITPFGNIMLIAEPEPEAHVDESNPDDDCGAGG